MSNYLTQTLIRKRNFLSGEQSAGLVLYDSSGLIPLPLGPNIQTVPIRETKQKNSPLLNCCCSSRKLPI